MKYSDIWELVFWRLLPGQKNTSCLFMKTIRKIVHPLQFIKFNPKFLTIQVTILIDHFHQFKALTIKQKKIGVARLLSKTTRYIDDLCIFNYKRLDKIIPSIYPDSLEANRCGLDNKDYLDVKLKVTSTGLKTAVYHKVDDFNFPVTLLTSPENAPQNWS